MKKVYIILSLLFLISVIACKKDIQKNDPTPEPSPTPTTSVSPSFDWSMQHDVFISLKNTAGKIVSIAPVGSEDSYIKLFCQEDTYSTSIKMAKSVQSISINGNTVSINNRTVDYTLPNNYKSVASATQALSFNDVDEDYVITGDPAIDAYPFTMEAWIKTAGLSDYTDDGVIMSYCNSGEIGLLMGVILNSNGADQGKITVRTQNGNAGTIVEATGTTDIRDDEWHHIAVVFDAEDSRLLYLDGVLEFTDTQISQIAPDANNLFTIGRWGDDTPSSYFKGLIDEVRLWNTSRSISQINYYRTRSVNAASAGLVGYWDMEEGSGLSTANQTSTSGLDGSLLSESYGANESPEAPNWVGDIDSDGDGIVNVNDNYPHDATRAFNNYWPATPYTLAFEDLWPSMGDYDMNDMVVNYRFNRITNASNNLVEVYGYFNLEAAGASLGKGFGFELQNAGISQSDFSVYVPASQKGEGYISYNANGTETGQDNPVVIVHELLPNIGNTEETYVGSRSYNIRIDMIATDKTVNYFDLQNWNPFFILKVGLPDFDRRQEVHLPGYTPTTIAAAWTPGTEILYFDSINDGSNYPTGGVDGTLWYKTNEKAILWNVDFGQYFPWGLDIPADFEWTIESDATHEPLNGFYRFTIKYGYGDFENWAKSNGEENLDWYENITDEDFIFQIP